MASITLKANVVTDSSSAATVYLSTAGQSPYPLAPLGALWYVESISYVKNDFASGVDFTITEYETGRDIWTESDVNASDTHQNPVGISGQIKIVIANGGNAKVGTFIFKLVDEMPVIGDAATHTHVISDVTGLTAALAAKLDEELDPTPDSDHTFRGPSVTLTAGENLAFPDCVYPKSDSKMGKADGDSAATAPVVAMASATIANNATGVFILPGSFVRDDTWNWTPGGYIYLDTTTAGGLTQTAPSGTDDVVQIIGWAYTADIMFFNPQLVTVVVV